MSFLLTRGGIHFAMMTLLAAASVVVAAHQAKRCLARAVWGTSLLSSRSSCHLVHHALPQKAAADTRLATSATGYGSRIATSASDAKAMAEYAPLTSARGPSLQKPLRAPRKRMTQEKNVR